MQKQEIRSKSEALRIFSAPDFRFPPLKLCVRSSKQPDTKPIVEVSNGAQSFQFAADYKERLTPGILDEIAWKSARSTAGHSPMILTSYLSETNLQRLEQLQISALDLNGNGIVVVPNELFVLRSGRPNEYALPQPSLNPYNGATSLVSRTLLLCDEFSTAKNLLLEAKQRGAGNLTLGTVSKALQTLEDDQIVSRKGRAIRLIDGGLLLDKLEQNFQPAKVLRSLRGKCSTEVLSRVFAQANDSEFRLTVTGKWSTQVYSAAARFGTISVYCSSIDRFLEIAGEQNFQEDEFFPDIELLETGDRTVFYDSRISEPPLRRWASPIQTYLELQTSRDKREQETARQIKDAVWSDANNERTTQE